MPNQEQEEKGDTAILLISIFKVSQIFLCFVKATALSVLIGLWLPRGLCSVAKEEPTKVKIILKLKAALYSH